MFKASCPAIFKVGINFSSGQKPGEVNIRQKTGIRMRVKKKKKSRVLTVEFLP